MWTCETTAEDKHYFKFEGLRNILACSFSRYDEFLAASEQLKSMEDYEVKAYEFIPHNTIYLYDSEGISMKFKVVD